jgi:ribosomal protein L29
MKVTKLSDEFKQMHIEQLQEKLEQLRGELFALRLKAKTSHIKNHAEFKFLRGNIARILTFMREKNMHSATQ